MARRLCWLDDDKTYGSPKKIIPPEAQVYLLENDFSDVDRSDTSCASHSSLPANQTKTFRRLDVKSRSSQIHSYLVQWSAMRDNGGKF